MKLRSVPFTLAARGNLCFRLSLQTWHLQRSQAYVHSAAGDVPAVRRGPHPRQRPLGRPLSTPASEFGVDPDKALQTAIMSLKTTKAQNAPIPDKYDDTELPPDFATVCKRLGLSLPKTNGAIRDRRTGLNFTVSRKHCFHDYHMPFIMDPLSPFRDWALDMHTTRHEKEALWIHVLPQNMKNLSAVVGTRAGKRAKHAFAAALERMGYGRYGWPLSDREAKRVGVAPASGPLYGTVRVRIFDVKKFCAVPFATVVDALEGELRGKMGSQLGLAGASGSRLPGGVRMIARGGEARPRDGDKGLHGERNHRPNRRPQGPRSDGSGQDTGVGG